MIWLEKVQVLDLSIPVLRGTVKMPSMAPVFNTIEHSNGFRLHATTYPILLSYRTAHKRPCRISGHYQGFASLSLAYGPEFPLLERFWMLAPINFTSICGKKDETEVPNLVLNVPECDCLVTLKVESGGKEEVFYFSRS